MEKTLLSTQSVREVKINTNGERLSLTVQYYDNGYMYFYECYADAPAYAGDMRLKLNEAYQKILNALVEGKQYVEIDL